MTDPNAHGGTIDQELLSRFESAWRAGRPEPIERFLPGEDDAGYLTTLEELVQIEMRLAWESWSKATHGTAETRQDQTVCRPAQLETYLQRFPRLNRPEIVGRLLQQECSARKQCGEAASIEEYRRRFPEVEVELAEKPVESELPMVSQSSRDVRMAETLATGPPGGAPVPGIEQQEFGNYESLEEIGRGGMGVVYRARQRTADRTVALKVIRRDRLEQLPRDTHSSALERFRHEAQAAARLEHENIVTVYEVGEVDDQPFFSMRYVEGRSLSQILRDGPMENRRAAAYLEPVARAVHEAHCQGILHRDLKPQNILVDDKTDRALVADFGLAKLTEGGEELTRAGEIMGTPSYMSPEQAKDSARVGAETDVYALGATLYHVLTARPPFQAATPVETLRQVIDEEPAPPRQLNPSIDRDLETICLKCLQKEPLRRYDSAHALADDLRRYLKGEPIQARPIGAVGRIWRWCRRKPALATAIGLAAAFLVVGSVVSTVLLVKTLAALEDSDRSLGQARKTVEGFYTLVSQETLLNEPEMQELRQTLLEKALEHYKQILDRHRNDPTSRDDLAQAYFHIGVVTELIKTQKAAMPFYELARDMQVQLLSERPGDPERLQSLGKTWTAMGSALSRQGKFNEARKAHQAAIAVRKQLVDKAAPSEIEPSRTLANSYMNLGIIEMNLGIIADSKESKNRQYKEAGVQLSKAQTVRENLRTRVGDSPETRRDRAKGYYNLASLALLTGDAKEAKHNFNAAIAVFEELLEKDPEVLDNQSDLATCYRLLGDVEEDLGSARRSYEEARKRMEKLAQPTPAPTRYRVALGNLHLSLGEFERYAKKNEAARTAFEEARAIFAELVEEFPGNAQYKAQRKEAEDQIAALSPAGRQDDAPRQDE